MNNIHRNDKDATEVHNTTKQNLSVDKGKTPRWEN